MFNSIIKILVSPVVAVLTAAGVLTTPIIETRKIDSPFHVAEEIFLGADLNLPAGLANYNVAGSGISSSATSITLASLTIPQTGQELVDSDFSDTFYITVEPGSRKYQEFVSCTTVTQNSGDTATLSGCSRGLSPITPYTASTSLAFAHAGGSQVIFSNSPQFYNELASKDNDETITGVYTFTSTAAPKYNTSYTATGNEFVSYTQLNNVAIAGAGTSTEASLGLVELATEAEATAGTASSSAGGPLVLASRYATSSNDVAQFHIVGTQSDGTIKSNMIDTDATYAWSGANSYTASTTFSFASTTFNGVEYKMPSANGASSTVLVNNGAGLLAWQAAGTKATSTVFATAGTYTWTKPTGVSKVKVRLQGGGGGGGSGSGGGSGGGGGAYAEAIVTVTGNVTVTVGAGGAAAQTGTASSFAGAVTVSAGGGSEGASAGGTTGGAGGTSTNADFSVDGQVGASLAMIGTSGGLGGGSFMGYGGWMSASNGLAGTGYGGGGAGSTGNNTGGAGSAGIVIVEWQESIL